MKTYLTKTDKKLLAGVLQAAKHDGLSDAEYSKLDALCSLFSHTVDYWVVSEDQLKRKRDEW